MTVTDMTVTDAADALVQQPVEHATVRIGAVDGVPASAPTSAPVDAIWGIAIERPIAITINGAAWTVMLATPCDLEDLARGLAVTERVVRDVAAVQEVVVSSFLKDMSVDLRIAEDQITTSAIRSRSLAGNSSCGLCGLESLADLHRVSDDRQRTRSGRVESDANVLAPISDAAVLHAFASLSLHQPINRETHSVHAAAWCTPDGTIVLVREDVGRHNALDKLIGALAHRQYLTQPGFIVMSSRCSYELVYKAAVTDAMLLATISAPTSMALEWSRALSLPLVCRIGGASDGRLVHFDAGDANAG